MLRIEFSRLFGSLLSLTLLAATGCNDAGTSGPNDAENNRLPLLSVGEAPARPVTNFNATEPTDAEPTPAAIPDDGEPTPATAPQAGITPAEAELAQSLQLWAACEEGSIAADARREKLNQIIERTSRAIDLTRGHAEEADVLNLSAITRANARVQLALMNDSAAHADQATSITQADLLAQDADALFSYDATSMAAVETAYRVVELTRELAERHADSEDTQWVSGYSRQARLFAERFPQEGHRAAMNLVFAAITCERAALMDEARQCYTAITANFVESLAAIDAAKVLARIDAGHAPMVGEELIGLAGETLDGAWMDLTFPQSTKVVVFWKTDSPEFRRQCERFGVWNDLHGEQFQIIAVNLDSDEALIREFTETMSIPAIVLFPRNPQLRGANHPIAKWFEVSGVPEYWLIDSSGTVIMNAASFAEVDEILTQLASPIPVDNAIPFQ